MFIKVKRSGVDHESRVNVDNINHYFSNGKTSTIVMKSGATYDVDHAVEDLDSILETQSISALKGHGLQK